MDVDVDVDVQRCVRGAPRVTPHLDSETETEMEALPWPYKGACAGQRVRAAAVDGPPQRIGHSPHSVGVAASAVASVSV